MKERLIPPLIERMYQRIYIFNKLKEWRSNYSLMQKDVAGSEIQFNADFTANKTH